MKGDWIKLHRQLLNSAPMRDDFLCRLWIWCLLKTNFADREWPFGMVPAGSFVTGRIAASEVLNVHPSKWYRGMKSLERMGCISMKPNSSFTVVSICKWETYQGDEDEPRTTSEQQMNSKRTADEQRMNTTKEGNTERTKERKKSSAAHPAFVAAFKAAWEECYPGEVFFFDGPKDGAAAKAILKAVGDDPARWEKIFGRYFADGSDFFRGHALVKLRQQLHRFLTDGTPNGKASQDHAGLLAFAQRGDEHEAG